MFDTCFIAASSGFTDKALFLERVTTVLATSKSVVCRSNTQVATWLEEYFEVNDLDTEFCEKETYSQIETKEFDSVILFWDGESKNVERLIERYPKATVIRFVNATTQAFYDYIGQIHNEDWQEGCMVLAKALPRYFWNVAASSSGKYHPVCDLGVGGLVRHSTMVCQVGLDLLDAGIFMSKTDELEDMVRVACLFHDGLKQGEETGGQSHTAFEHPVLAEKKMREVLTDYIEADKLDIICQAVRRHMGRWNTSTYAPGVELETPQTPFDKLIHTADYVASRKYIGGLDIWK